MAADALLILPGGFGRQYGGSCDIAQSRKGIADRGIPIKHFHQPFRMAEFHPGPEQSARSTLQSHAIPHDCADRLQILSNQGRIIFLVPGILPRFDMIKTSASVLFRNFSYRHSPFLLFSLLAFLAFPACCFLSTPNRSIL
jgi:hypothetical protein